jgi:hypothetical protein
VPQTSHVGFLLMIRYSHQEWSKSPAHLVQDLDSGTAAIGVG